METIATFFEDNPEEQQDVEGTPISLSTAFRSGLNTTEVEAGYTPDTKRQDRILEALDDDLIEHIYAHVMSAEIMNAHFEAEHAEMEGRKPNERRMHLSERQVEKVIKGELFEQLIRAEKLEMCPERFRRLAEETLSVSQNTHRHNLEKELGQNRNPDLTFLEITQAGDIIIRGVGEAKTGPLDYRAFQQLRRFYRSISDTVDALNIMRRTKKNEMVTEHGLYEWASLPAETKVKVDRDLQRYLYVPAEKDPNNLDSLINYRDFRSPIDIDLFKGMLESSVIIEKGAFSSRELDTMTKQLLESIKQKYFKGAQ